VPSFVTHVPSGHFAGVSAPSGSISEARHFAIDDVVRQILSAVNIEYDHRYADRVSGNVRGEGLKRVVDDRLSKVAHGVVLGIERNIVKSSWSQNRSGKYVYFILVRYPDTKIREMRRLSKGAKIATSVLFENHKNVKIRVAEVNGVSVVLSSADLIIRKRNRFAKLISYYVIHVPKGSEKRISIAINPVRICRSSRDVTLPLSGCKKGLSGYLLGAKIEKIAVLRGHDEIGRKVSVRVVF